MKNLKVSLRKLSNYVIYVNIFTSKIWSGRNFGRVENRVRKPSIWSLRVLICQKTRNLTENLPFPAPQARSGPILTDVLAIPSPALPLRRRTGPSALLLRRRSGPSATDLRRVRSGGRGELSPFFRICLVHDLTSAWGLALWLQTPSARVRRV
jgi:hypothetical protein